MEASVAKPRNHNGPDLTCGGLNPYNSWKQIAAYFDGDGSVSTRVRVFTLSFSLEFSESYFPQLVQVRDFLTSEGIPTRTITTQRRRSGYSINYVLRVDTQREVLLVCKRLLPFSFKKNWDLQTTIDYLEDRITGEEAIRRFNVSIESGRREGLVRAVSMPFKKSEGIRMSALIGGRQSGTKRAKLNREQVELLRRHRDTSGETYAQLARLFGASSDVMRSALGRK